MPRQQNRKRPIASINIVPYIDVMLVLLAIFMITTPLLTQGVKVKLPSTHAKIIDTKKGLPLIVSIDLAGHYYLNTDFTNIPLNAQQLAVRVEAELEIAKRNNKHRQVLVKGDKAVVYGKVVQVMTLLQKSGVTEVGLMTQQPP